MVQMRGHNIWIYEELTKINPNYYQIARALPVCWWDIKPKFTHSLTPVQNSEKYIMYQECRIRDWFNLCTAPNSEIS